MVSYALVLGTHQAIRQRMRDEEATLCQVFSFVQSDERGGKDWYQLPITRIVEYPLFLSESSRPSLL